jgi:hypothetical protein
VATLWSRSRKSALGLGEGAEDAGLDVGQLALQLAHRGAAGVCDDDASGAAVGRVGPALDQAGLLEVVDGTPKEGWDHVTPYLRRILGEVFGLDVHIAEAELTHAFWNPEMASLRGLADESLRLGHEQAAEHGLRVARLIRV